MHLFPESVGETGQRRFLRARYEESLRADLGPAERARLLAAWDADYPPAADRARQLIREGYRQVSRKHRIVARLPDGKTGRQALTEAIDRREDSTWIRRLSERAAQSQFLRVYAVYTGDPLWLTLDKDTFDAFRRLGGESA